MIYFSDAAKKNLHLVYRKEWNFVANNILNAMYAMKYHY